MSSRPGVASGSGGIVLLRDEQLVYLLRRLRREQPHLYEVVVTLMESLVYK